VRFALEPRACATLHEKPQTSKVEVGATLPHVILIPRPREKDPCHFAQRPFRRRAGQSPFRIYLSLSAGERVDGDRRFHQPTRDG
jgi:hypothetical protein